jgi:hypothetical protein
VTSHIYSQTVDLANLNDVHATIIVFVDALYALANKAAEAGEEVAWDRLQLDSESTLEYYGWGTVAAERHTVEIKALGVNNGN